MFDLRKFSKRIICENGVSDAAVQADFAENQFDLSLTAKHDKVKFIELTWAFESVADYLVLSDAWERSYGDLCFKPLDENDRYMPWCFLATDRKNSFCFGVKTRPNAFICFRYTEEGITALIDCRNGGCGVHLDGRTLHLATFVYKDYENCDVTACLHDYCKILCNDPIIPNERIYGGNNWYHAYGRSSREEILRDTKVQVALSQGIDNKPFQIIDDGWQPTPCCGPWLANEKFGDMKALAAEMKTLGARPGIWIRLLHNVDPAISDDMRIARAGKREYLDPTHPKTKQYITNDILRIKSWGFELLKHDFTTVDLFGEYGTDLTDRITRFDDWHFYDKTKTNAEIVLDLYRLIREAAGDMYLIGCNTVSHLCAGLVELNRIGDDTSGREWARTRKMGINTLAFRLAHHKAFYLCDADCVGIRGEEIPWEKNRQWLHLLSYSNTPLFVSCSDDISENQRSDIMRAYTVFQEEHRFKPVDIFDTETPAQWEIDGEVVRYNW